jgi:hypothetical protein
MGAVPALLGCLLLLGGCRRASVTISPGDLTGDAAAVKHRETAAGKEAAPGDTFPFPDDRGGKLLGEALAPPADVPPPGPLGVPRHFSTAAAVDAPRLPLPHDDPGIVRLPSPKPAGEFRPAPVPEPPPLVGDLSTPVPPEEPRLLAGDRVREPSEDVARPVPLPPLAQPAPDRASLDDPTAEASQAAAVAARLPQRATPAPPLRLSIPDPYENRRAVRLRALPPEQSGVATSGPRTPKP